MQALRYEADAEDVVTMEDEKVAAEKELNAVIEEGSHPLSDSFEGELFCRGLSVIYSIYILCPP